MTDFDGHELGRSFDCKIPGCTNEAKAGRGRYALLCDEHADAKRMAAPPVAPAPQAVRAGERIASFEAAAKDLVTLGRKADLVRSRMRPALEKAKRAKDDADTAKAEFLNAVRALLEHA